MLSGSRIVRVCRCCVLTVKASIKLAEKVLCGILRCNLVDMLSWLVQYFSSILLWCFCFGSELCWIMLGTFNFLRI